MSKNKFTVAIIGVGGRGGYAYGTLISQLPDQFEIVSLCDINTDKLSYFSKKFNVDFDETGSIGKRYRREDEIGTPFCITYDFDTETDGCVTVRDRDTMEQVRIPVSELRAYIEKKIEF